MNVSADDWRPWLRRKIGWLLIFKLAALVVLWLLFFSPPHRVSVDEDTMSERIAPPDRGNTRSTISHSKQDVPDDV